MKPILPVVCTVAALAMMLAPISRAESTAPATPAAIPADVTAKVKAKEGLHLGQSFYPTSTPIGDLFRETDKEGKPVQDNTPKPVEVSLGHLLGIFATEPEAIISARLNPGSEALKRTKGDDGKYYYAIFEVGDFEFVGKKFIMDPSAGRFAIVEEDKVAEEKYRATHDARLAVHQANEIIKDYDKRRQLFLRRYDDDTPIKTKLCELLEI